MSALSIKKNIMIVIDFLFYYTAIQSKKRDKNRIRHLDPTEGARNLIFISTFLWFLYIVMIYNYIFLNKLSYSIPWYWTLALSILIYEILTVIYIKRKRFQKICEREQGSNPRFKISEKTGIIIASIYVYGGMAGIIVGLFILHFIVYG